MNKLHWPERVPGSPNKGDMKVKVVKLVTPVIIAILLLAVSCTGPAGKPPQEIPSPSPEPAPTSPPAPTLEPEQPPAPKPVPEREDTTIQFVWTVDPGVRLEDATVPNIYRLEGGRLRMYYGGPGGILSAISQDGLAFTKETGVRVPSGSSGSPEMIVSDPTLVTLKDGRARMYYKGATGPGGSWIGHHPVRHGQYGRSQRQPARC